LRSLLLPWRKRGRGVVSDIYMVISCSKLPFWPSPFILWNIQSTLFHYDFSGLSTIRKKKSKTRKILLWVMTRQTQRKKVPLLEESSWSSKILCCSSSNTAPPALHQQYPKFKRSLVHVQWLS